MEARSIDPWILASALVKLSSPEAGLFPVGRARFGFQNGNLRLPATQLQAQARRGRLCQNFQWKVDASAGRFAWTRHNQG